MNKKNKVFSILSLLVFVAMASVAQAQETKVPCGGGTDATGKQVTTPGTVVVPDGKGTGAQIK